MVRQLMSVLCCGFVANNVCTQSKYGDKCEQSLDEAEKYSVHAVWVNLGTLLVLKYGVLAMIHKIGSTQC